MRVPLAGAVTGEWLRCYQELAVAAKVPALAQARHDRAWIVVSVPATSDQGQVAATLDAARALIARADATAERPPATVQVEASVRDWWAGRRAGAPGSPVSGPGIAGARAEKRWPMALTLVVAIAVPLLLPPRFSLSPSWAVPAVEALLLVAIVAIDRGRIDRRSTAGRALSLGLVAVLVASAVLGSPAGWSAISWRAVRRPIRQRICSRPASWSGSTRSLPLPSSTGCLTEVVLNRGFWLRRSSRTSPSPGSSTRGLSPPGWRPEFFDYLYLGFTDATAFSPTDVMPLARWAKFAMTVEAVVSLVVLGTGDCPGGQYLEVDRGLGWRRTHVRVAP